MATNEIKVGDNVKIKSIKGPSMVVNDLLTYRGKDSAQCIYFKEGELQSHVFNLSILEKIASTSLLDQVSF